MLERNDQNGLSRLGRLIRDVPLFALFKGTLVKESIPSFIFHKVLPDEFEAILAYLKSNHYRTLNPGEYYDYLRGKKADTDKKVILTFDDGLRNNWSVAYPLLKKWGMHAVFYINPGIMTDGEEVPGPTLENVWSGQMTIDEMQAFELRSPFVNWGEAKVMEASGFASIESHGWRHRICFVGDKIIDFQRPDRAGNPVYSWLFTAIDAKFDEPLWGMPVYPYQPRLASRRFLDDAGLRRACMDYVSANGGKDFFTRGNWRSLLTGQVLEYKAGHLLKTRYENSDEQELAIRDSLVNAQKMIEQKLGKRCEHFAYPWHASGRISLLWLRELGVKTVFRAMRSYRVPKPGDDPFNLSRVEGYWIPYLPGTGRKSVWNRLGSGINYAIRGL
jgi:hypothetical protein